MYRGKKQVNNKIDETVIETEFGVQGYAPMRNNRTRYAGI